MQPWIFDNFKYFEESRLLELPGGKSVPLRPKIGTLLLLFLNNAGKLLSYELLKKKIWPDSTTVTVRHIHGLKDELEEFFGGAALIKPVSGAGYIFTAQSVLSPADNRPKQGDVLHVFPGAGTVAGSAYVHSWVGHGRNDSVIHATEKVKWEKNARQLISLNPDVPSVLSLPFKHVVIAKSPNESWWVAVLPVYTDRVTSNWQPVDLRSYDKLVVEARGQIAKNSAPIFLRARLEDGSDSSRSGSRRQSSDWHPLTLALPSGFFAFELNLDGFNWTKEAWRYNTAPPDRSRIVQLVLGQDAGVPSCSGTIEIRNVRLIPKSTSSLNQVRAA